MYDKYQRMIFVKDLSLEEVRRRASAIPEIGTLVAWDVEPDPNLTGVPSEYRLVIDLYGTVDGQAGAVPLILEALAGYALSDEQAWALAV